MNQPGIAQDRKVVRNGRLREANLGHYITDAGLPAAAELHDPLARLVGYGFGKFNGIDQGVARIYIDNCLYVDYIEVFRFVKPQCLRNDLRILARGRVRCACPVAPQSGR